MNRHGDRKSTSLLAALGGLGWPLLVGLALTSVFYALVFRGPLNTAIIHRYFSCHPVLVVETALFFVGLSALILKLGDVLFQSASLGRISLEPSADDEAANETVAQLLDRLTSLPRRSQDTYLGSRLREALEYVELRGSGEGLSVELKYLSDLAAARQQESYSLVQIVIWATPMLGFLGTVMGITQALGDLNPEVLATDPKTAMQGMLAGLYVAFDTTALALCLSMVLMFVKFLTDRFESHLLTVVDERVNDELLARFNDAAAERDPHLAAVQRMSVAVIRTTEQMVRDQTEHWKRTMQEAGGQLQTLLESFGRTVQAALTQSLEASVSSFAESLARAERETDERLRARWEQWQTVLSDNARLLHSQQGELVRQGELMTQVLQATGDVMKLERALNDNLRALAGSKNFEDTVMSLSAAIHLLNTRLETVPYDPIELDTSVKQGRAA